MGKKRGPVQQGADDDAKNVEALSKNLDAKYLDSDPEDVVHAIEEAMSEDAQFFDTEPNYHTQAPVLTEQEREEIDRELQKTEEEINTLRQVLAARQKHVAELKRKLGVTPWTEVTQDINRGFSTVRDTTAYQKTSEVVGATAETVKNKLSDLKNSNFYKSFESKLSSAANNAKMAASTSIDHLSGRTYGSTPPPEAAATPTTETITKQPPSS